MIVRLIISLIAIAMIVVGTVLMISPVPLGIFIVVLGFLVLVIANPHARPLLRWFRRRWPWLNRRIQDLEESTPPTISEPLKETDPDEQ